MPPSKLNSFSVFTTTESRAKIWHQYKTFKPLKALAVVHSKAVFFLIGDTLFNVPSIGFWGFCVCLVCCYALLKVLGLKCSGRRRES